jgi:hypothetical protein
MLNIESTNVNAEKPKIAQYKYLKFYDTDSVDFTRLNVWAMDDGPFVANLDFLMTKIYDATYYSLGDIWTAERYLNNKIRQMPIQRLTTNKCLFSRFYIVGMNIQSREDSLKKLKELFCREP